MSDKRRPADFEVYTWGLVSASVCTSLSIEDATRRLNDALPTGIPAKWTPAEDATFADGIRTNPCPCNERPSTHKHYLFQC